MLFVSFMAGFVIGIAVMSFGIVLAVIDSGERKNLTKEEWKAGLREK